MKKLLCCLAVAALAAGVSAAPIDITVSDGLPTGCTWGEYDGGENDAVNFGSNPYQEFDLEAFYFDNGILSLQSGLNVDVAHSQKIMLGDIFIDIVGTSQEYDYAVTFNRSTNGAFTNHNYEIVSLASDFTSEAIFEPGHQAALPYAVKTGGTAVTGANGTFNQAVISSGTQVWSGATKGDGSVYLIDGIDLSPVIASNANFNLHVTETCGNDVLKASVPEPAFLSLLGISLIGLAFYRRKK